MVWVVRFIPLFLLVSLLIFPAPSLSQTYGSGEVEYGGVRLQFSGQLATAGVCQQFSANLIRCQVPQGTQGTIRLTATRNPAGSVNIRADATPAGWPAFQVASGWGTVSKQYSFTVPSGSAGKRFELVFRAWATGVVGEVELKFIIDSVTPATPTTPTTPTYPPTPTKPVPAPAKIPKIQVVPDRLDFGEVIAGDTVTSYFTIRNAGNDSLRVDSVSIGVAPIPIAGPFSTVRPYPVPFILSPGDSTIPFIVTFNPPEPGKFSDEVRITSNDPQRPQVIVPLNGKAVPRPVVIRPPEEVPPPGEGEAVPPKEAEGKCPECLLSVLTQNCQLIPSFKPFYGGTPHAVLRAQEIGKLVAGEWADRYKIICLQEVFSYAGKDFSYKNVVAGAELSEKNWHRLVQDRQAQVDGEEVQLLARLPSATHATPQIAVLKKGDRYIITGPDSTASPRFTVDSGLMILTKYPVIAASGFIFTSYPRWSLWSFWEIPWEAFSNKGVIYARIQLDPDNPACYIHVFNTHLVADEKNREIRQKQMNEIREFIKKCTEDPQNKGEPDGHPIIFCGDFNVIAGTDEHKNMKNILKMVDAWQKARGDKEDHSSATWVGKGKLAEVTPWGKENVLAVEKGSYQRIDYILYQIFQPKTKQPTLELVFESIDREPAEEKVEKYPWGGHTGSDHLGAGAQFKIRPAAVSR